MGAVEKMKKQIFNLILLLSLCLGVTAQAQHNPLPGSLPMWMHAEQNLNDKNGYRIPPRDHSSLNREHQAESGSWFQVKSYWIPESELNVAELLEMMPEQLKKELVREQNGKRFFRLFVHPESESFYQSLTSKYHQAEPAIARATASSRTVLMSFQHKPEILFFAKLSLNVNLGNVVRTIPEAETAQSVGLSSYILNKAKKLGPEFKFIPETLGIIPKGWPRGGQIIRPIPPEVLKGQTRLLPLFSLTAPQKQGTILENMIRESGKDPYQFARESILIPFVKGWTEWAIEGALSMEAHSQNVLIEVDHRGLPTGVFHHRDMGGMNLDMSSPFVSSSELEKLPVFSELKGDYHQNFTAQARETSLAVYFRERFLYNIDRELQKLDPNYVPGKLMKDLWIELQKSIHEYTGMPKQKLSLRSLEAEIPKILKAAAQSRRVLRPQARACGKVHSSALIFSTPASF